MNRQLQLTILAISLGWACAAAAQEIYKSIDDRGRVVYSSSPPPDAPAQSVEKVEIAPDPTEQEREEAAQRAQELQESTQGKEQQRQEKATEAEQARSEAEIELRNAKAALEEAKIRHAEDWQFHAGRGRVLKPGYRERVAAAERRVEEAEQAVRAAR